jgi:hypothetical protein
MAESTRSPSRRRRGGFTQLSPLRLGSGAGGLLTAALRTALEARQSSGLTEEVWSFE